MKETVDWIKSSVKGHMVTVRSQKNERGKEPGRFYYKLTSMKEHVCKHVETCFCRRIGSHKGHVRMSCR